MKDLPNIPYRGGPLARVVLALPVQTLKMFLPDDVRIPLEARKDNLTWRSSSAPNRRGLRISGAQVVFRFALIFIMATSR